MQIDIHTKMITLLGTPLSQSFAARMQNRAYEEAGLNMLYFYTETDHHHLGDVVNGLRHMNFAGFAVTKPNKVEVLKYLDELDPLCRKMGASNTVVRTDDGKLIGYNTDGAGFYRAITQDAGIDVEKNVFLCVGSGGAGRAICSILAYHNAKRIYVNDVIVEAGKSLVEDINRNFAKEGEILAEFVHNSEAEKIGLADVVINASGVGMGKTIGQTAIPKEYIRPEQFCFDACYNPEKTQFLLDAEEKGCRIMNGLGMALYQGAAQIELWTGKEAPIEAMRQELYNILHEM